MLHCNPFPAAVDAALGGAEGAFGCQPLGPLWTVELARGAITPELNIDPAERAAANAFTTAAAAAAPRLAPREPRAALLGPPGCAEVVAEGEEEGEVAARRAARARAAQQHTAWVSHLGLVRNALL